jgi:hypothetical protein
LAGLIAWQRDLDGAREQVRTARKLLLVELYRTT